MLDISPPSPLQWNPFTIETLHVRCIRTQQQAAKLTGGLESLGRPGLLSLKTSGFSDRQIARYTSTSENQVLILL